MPAVPEPAVAAGEDPRSYARLMSAVYDATMTGTRAPARPREVIADSWQRMLARGINPDTHIPPVVETAGLEMLRRSSGLADVLDEVSRGLETVIAEGANILVVADATGRVLWRSGVPAVLHNADRLGFVEGAHWGESAVGTNAIGTALASNRAVQVFSAEHFLRSHHAWTCAGAPSATPARDTSSASSTCRARPPRCTPPPSPWSTSSRAWPNRICANSTIAP
jgi:transcriptional regulator of acetoin/glycerol metabolism